MDSTKVSDTPPDSPHPNRFRTSQHVSRLNIHGNPNSQSRSMPVTPERAHYHEQTITCPCAACWNYQYDLLRDISSDDSIFPMQAEYPYLGGASNNAYISSVTSAYNPNFMVKRELMKEIVSHFTCRGCGEICETSLANIIGRIVSGERHPSIDHFAVRCCRCRLGASKILENRSLACSRCLSITPGVSADLPSFM